MEITVNGEKLSIETAITMSNLLDELNIKREALAVELNKNILPKSEYDTKIIIDGDMLEIIQFVGGG
ncbi:sulfur carrier protein ThiS [bacterium]|nr:sulfur carrier protein ThiS [bacterium]